MLNIVGNYSRSSPVTESRAGGGPRVGLCVRTVDSGETGPESGNHG